jgi:hypothetical protein
MAKIPRKLLKQFGVNAGTTEIKQFGSRAAGSPVETKDIDTIQALAAFESGWLAATLTGRENSKVPTLEDMNALQYVYATQMKYLFQEGVPEWLATETYYIDGICKVGNIIYVSKVNDNIGNAPAGDTTNWGKALDFAGDITAPNLFKQNFLDNGGMQIYQRASAYTLAKDVYGFSVDRWAGMATGTLVSAGTLTQETASTLNNSGFSVKFSGATLTGTGILYLRQRIASQDAKKLKNQSVSIQFKVKHDVGSAINYTIFVRKADADNNFTTATNISNSGAISVATATDTIIKYENVALGDCSNGLEIEVKIECGAITTKNFEVSNAKLEIGTICTDFIDNSFADEFEKCKFYFFKITGATGNISNNTLYGSLFYNFGINMIKIPVITLNSVTVYEINNVAANPITSIRINKTNINSLLLEVNLGWTGLAYRPYLQDGGNIFANSEI